MKLEVADIHITRDGVFCIVERGRFTTKYCPYRQGQCVQHCAYFMLEDRGPMFEPYEQRCRAVLACGKCEPIEYVSVHITDMTKTMEEEAIQEETNE